MSPSWLVQPAPTVPHGCSRQWRGGTKSFRINQRGDEPISRSTLVQPRNVATASRQANEMPRARQPSEADFPLYQRDCTDKRRLGDVKNSGRRTGWLHGARREVIGKAIATKGLSGAHA
jgi:hypothetical protein